MVQANRIGKFLTQSSLELSFIATIGGYIKTL